MTSVALHAPRAGVDRDAIARFVRDAAAAAVEGRRFVSIRVPAPVAPLETLALSLVKTTSCLWMPPTGPRFATHGAAAVIRLSGADRFQALGPEARALFDALEPRVHPRVSARPPRLFGGWAFAEGGADAAPWTGFGDGCFVLPRWSYERTGSEAALSLALDARSGRASLASLAMAELATVWDALLRPPPLPRTPAIVRVEHTPREAWRAQVEAITRAIARGELDKVVAARRSAVFAAAGLEPAAIARHLADRYPDTFTFALRLEGATFIGASPERLFAKRGRAVEADAIAGSIAAEHPGAEALLFASGKDQREHRPVVAHLRERLAPCCTSLSVDAAPRVRRLPNVLHLETSLRGVLADGVEAPALAAALHPTPAVGGAPHAAALAFLRAHEAAPRGWYAGPVGWIDAAGDAELAVALRSALVRGSSAWLYAGAGIVEGSDPDAEWRETAWKLRPMLGALGAS